MKIIIDAMGGDNAPMEIVKGAVEAAQTYGVDIILAGQGGAILKCFQEQGMQDLPKGIEIADASEVITMEDDPTVAARTKKDSSMTVGLKMLADGQADAMVSAGSTGALLSGATIIVKRIRGIRRAALAPLLPSTAGGVLLMDCGANVECTPEYLLQFAYMGSFYAKSMMGVETPRVGLMNIGTEPTKGGILQKETFAALQKAGEEGRIRFVGNVEARDVLFDACDVCVCDGFTGNIFLKGMEGMGMFILSELKKTFMESKKNQLAAAMLKPAMKEVKKKVDPSEIGGTALLGISKPVIKAHGSSDATAIRNAVLQAVNTAKAGIAESIRENIDYMKMDTTATLEVK